MEIQAFYNQIELECVTDILISYIEKNASLKTKFEFRDVGQDKEPK